MVFLFLHYHILKSLLVKTKTNIKKDKASDLLASREDQLVATPCEGVKSKRYIPPEWLKKKRCELKLSMFNIIIPTL